MLLSATGFKVIRKVCVTFQLQYFAVGLLGNPSLMVLSYPPLHIHPCSFLDVTEYKCIGGGTMGLSVW